MKRRSIRWKRPLGVIIGDLSLLLSICIARFIVWRTIHVRHKERLARLRNLRLIKGGVPPSTAGGSDGAFFLLE